MNRLLIQGAQREAKRLRAENARLREDFGKIFVAFLQDDRDAVNEVFKDVYRLDFTNGSPVFADALTETEAT